VYRGTLLPPRYIGSSTVQRVLGGYNGSVKSQNFKEVYRREQQVNKHLFKTRILMVFETQIEAVEAELKLQFKHNAVRSERYMNCAYAQPNGFFGKDIRGDNHPFYGREHSVNTKNKISETLKAKYDSGELVSPFTSLDSSGSNNGFFGRKHSAESLKKMSKPKSCVPKWQCPHCQKEYDGGNLTQHMRRNGFTPEQIQQVKAE
jgi:hypothetical protein